MGEPAFLSEEVLKHFLSFQITLAKEVSNLFKSLSGPVFYL